MTAYTLGPWTINHGSHVYGADESCVAIVHIPDAATRPFLHARANREANAKLIAAAPEMADALKAAWDFLASDDCTMVRRAETLATIYSALRTAGAESLVRRAT